MGVAEFLGVATADQDDDFRFSFDTPSVQPGDVLVLVGAFTVPGSDAVHIAAATSPPWTEAISNRGASSGEYLIIASREVSGQEGARVTVTYDTALTTSPIVVCLAYRGIDHLKNGHPFSVADVDGAALFPCPEQPRSPGDIYLGIAHDPVDPQSFTMPGNARFVDSPSGSTLGIFDLEASGAIGEQTAIADGPSVGTAMSLLLHALESGPYTRMLTKLLPPGRLWRPGAGTLQAVLEACAMELARIDGRAHDLITESDPTTALELLPEYERELGLVANGTTAERRANVVARHITRQRFRPADFRAALAPLLGQAAEDVVIIERTHAFAASIGDDREIYRFFVYRDPNEPGDYFLASAQALVDAMAPLHTQGHVIESIDFLCDDEFSLCDRDLLGA